MPRRYDKLAYVDDLWESTSAPESTGVTLEPSSRAFEHLRVSTCQWDDITRHVVASSMAICVFPETLEHKYDPFAGLSDADLDAMLADTAEFDRKLYEAAFPASLRTLPRSGS